MMSRFRSLLAFICLPLFLCACSNSGGYFQNDGPPSSVWGERDFSNAPNAVPKIETPHKAANRPYTINGVRYKPITGDAPMNQTGIASWYGKQFHGQKTSIGETYNMYAMTAAHTTMELPSYAKVTNLENGKSVIVRVNDRGPFLHNRVIDLSYAAASKLGYVKKGTAKVRVERIRRVDIKSGKFTSPSSIQFNETVDKISENRADLAALASIIGQQAIKNHSQTTVEKILNDNIPQPSEAPITVEPSTTSGFTITETKDELQGAINLTEIAKQGEMISTEISLSDQPSPLTVSTTTQWSIQAGVFSSEKNAIACLNRFKNLTSLPIEIFHENGKYRILIGEFQTGNIATEEAKKLSELIGEKLITFEKK